MIELHCPSCQVPVPAANPDDLPALKCPSCRAPFGFPPPRDDVVTILGIVGDLVGSEIVVDGEVSFGRAPGNTAKLRELKVSRRHAIIQKEGERYFVEDLQSGNGTYVNDRLVTRQELFHNDLVKISTSVFVFRRPGGARRDPTRDSHLVIGERSVFEQTKYEMDYSNQTLMQTTQPPGPGSGVESLEKANRKLRMLCEVTSKLSELVDLEELLQKILNALFEILPADRGAILLADPATGQVQNSVIKVSDDLQEAGALVISQSILNKVLGERKTILTSDTLVDDRFASAQSIISQGIRSAMSTPLVCRENLLGAIYLDSCRRSDDFSEDNLQLLAGIASQAAVAIENSMLMSRIAHETETRAHLQRYLSPALVDQVRDGRVSLDMGGQLKKLTILFSDIREFTPLSERYPAQDVVDLLNRYFEVMVDVIFKYGGTLDKFIGDAIMALWGTPVASPLDPLLAVRAALDMQKELFILNCQFRAEGKEPIRMGIGINTGEVVTGNMGSTKRMEYTVIGKEVNLAQRIESLTKAHQVFISEATYQEVKDFVRVIELEPTTVKGIRDRIKIYYCLAARADEHAPDERRVHERFKFFVPAVCIHERSGLEVDAAVVDVSKGGMGIQLLLAPPSAIDAGDSIRIRLAMDSVGNLGESRGIVVHRKSVFEIGDHNLAQFGVQFTEVGEAFEHLFGQPGPLVARFLSAKATQH